MHASQENVCRKASMHSTASDQEIPPTSPRLEPDNESEQPQQPDLHVNLVENGLQHSQKSHISSEEAHTDMQDSKECGKTNHFNNKM